MKKILIAEDDDTNFLIISKFIKKARGFEVERALNGNEVMSKITSEPDSFSCILMDIKMPLMSGIDATKKIRASGNNIPIIALTAAAMFGDKEIAFESGVNNYLTKPIDFDKLFIILDEIFAQS